MPGMTDAFLTGAANVSRFSWLTLDVASAMPAGWRDEIEKVARNDRITKRLIPPTAPSTPEKDHGYRADLTPGCTTHEWPDIS